MKLLKFDDCQVRTKKTVRYRKHRSEGNSTIRKKGWTRLENHPVYNIAVYANEVANHGGDLESRANHTYAGIVPRAGGTRLRSDHLDRAAAGVSLKHFQLFGLFRLLFSTVGEIPGASVHHLYTRTRISILLYADYCFPYAITAPLAVYC